MAWLGLGLAGLGLGLGLGSGLQQLRRRRPAVGGRRAAGGACLLAEARAGRDVDGGGVREVLSLRGEEHLLVPGSG